MRGLSRLLPALAVALLSLAVARPSWAGRCEDLARLQLPDTVIKRAEPVPAGAFIGPDKVRRPDLPAFCRVVASVSNAPDSDIGVEIWLPDARWTGVFHGNGSGGYGGVLSAGYGGMAAGLRRGYVSATTDTGTAPSTPLNGDALIGHPRKWRDWGLLSTHVMTVTGKAIARAYYGEAVRRSYYTGCSTGGQQGLIEAEYFPEDYDGVLIGAPVINRTWGHAAVLWDFLAANRLPGRKLSPVKLDLLHAAALSACAGKGDGLAADPFIADARACRFDPGVLTCRAAASDSCLTPSEAATARAFYSGPVNHAGQPVYYGWLPGSEAPGGFGWDFLETPPGGEPAFASLFKWVFGAGWDWRSFDFDRDMPRVDAVLGPAVNGAMRGSLDRFRARGGKLIIYQGWADTLVAPEQTLAFYQRLSRRAGGPAKARDFAVLFMAPGVMHCGGGAGPGAFNAANAFGGQPPANAPRYDLFAALSHWVEDGAAPREVVATRYVDGAPAKGVALQRPLCAWPQKAWYKGSGDTRDPDRFTCAVEKPATVPAAPKTAAP